MNESIRYGCWLIDNINFSGIDFTKTVDYKGQSIELLITNYENSKKLGEPFNDWICTKIINDGIMKELWLIVNDAFEF